MEQLIGLVLKDRYELVRELGRNPGRRTYLALDRHRYEQVILKLLLFGLDMTWDDFKLFEREAAVLQTLDHPGIPRYLDFFDVETPVLRGFALVQTYIEAQSLAAWLAAGRVFSEADLETLADRLLDILVYLHTRQPPVIHRDIKPTNILLGDRSGHELGNVYLIDFGAVQTAISGATRTVVGTYGYMPPEQFGGKTVPATDLYALGMTLIYLASGIPPDQLPQHNLHLEFQRVVALSPPLIRWLEQLVEPSLEHRFSSATAARSALQRLSEVSIPATLREPPYGSRLRVQETAQGVVVQVPPIGFNISLLFLIPFAVAWNGFLVVWYTLALSAGNWFMAIFATGHLAVGLGLIGTIFYILFGSQVLAITPTEVRFHQHILGLRWQRSKVLPVAAIEQVEVQPKGFYRNRDGEREQVTAKMIIRAGTQTIELEEAQSHLTPQDLEWLGYGIGRYLACRVIKTP